MAPQRASGNCPKEPKLSGSLLWYVTKFGREWFHVQNGEPGNRPSQRHVKPPQAIGLARGDAGGFDEDDVVELKAFGQRDRDDREPLGLLLRRRPAPSTRNARPAARSAAATSLTCVSAQMTATEPGHFERAGAGRRYPVRRTRPMTPARRQATRRPPAATRRAAAPARSTGAAGRRSPGSAEAPGSPRRARAATRPACPGAPAERPTTWPPTGWCPARCRRARSPPRWRSAGRSPGISIGDRSCASSTTTCARLGVRSIRSAASSSSTRSARDQRADPGPRGAGDHAIAACSGLRQQPGGGRGQRRRRRQQPEHQPLRRRPSATPHPRTPGPPRSAAPRRASGRRRSPPPPPSG